jgi:1-acyl-sn-glycerol-3-phosphate acyltransferase
MIRNLLRCGATVAFSTACYGAYTYRPLLSTDPTLLDLWPEDEVHWTHRFSRFLALKTVGFACYVFGTKLNKLTISDSDYASLQNAMLHRPLGQGLITVCNHTSTLDDPLLVSCLAGPNFPYNRHRWGICSRELGFEKGSLVSSFLGAGRALPVVRGAGIYQLSMERLRQLLTKGEWIHIFPEGKVWTEASFPVSEGYCLRSGRCSPPGGIRLHA